MNGQALWFLVLSHAALIACLLVLDRRGLQRLAQMLAVAILLLLLAPWVMVLWPAYADWVLGLFGA